MDVETYRGVTLKQFTKCRRSEEKEMGVVGDGRQSVG